MATATSKLLADIRKIARKAAFGGLLSLFLRVVPAPASRPRVTRWGGVYYGKNYTRFITEAQPLANAFDGIPTNRPVVVILEFICEKPRTGKLEMPNGDADNYAKGPLDVMTKAEKFWKDDTQVAGLVSFKRYALPGETPGVLVEWFEVAAN